MGITSQTMEDRGTEGEVECEGPVQKVSERKNISDWPRDHS